MTNHRLLIQNEKGEILINLPKYTCSDKAYEVSFLEEINHFNVLHRLGKVTLQDVKTSFKKKLAKDYGQKYKIGTRCFLNDDSKLDLEVESYDPNLKLYTVKIVKTGGSLKIKEKAISLTKPTGSKKINIDVDEEGELVETNQQDLSLPQEDPEAQVVYSEEAPKNDSVDANNIIKNQDEMANKIASQNVDIIYATDEEEKQKDSDGEEMFLVKSDSDMFAKEIKASKMAENVQEEVTKELKKVADVIKSEKDKKESKSREAEIDEMAFVELSSEMQQFISSFMEKDSRSKKMVIARCKDVEKLQAIAKCGDNLSKKAALAKLGKLNA